MQRKEEFSFLLFGFLTDPVHVNTEERKKHEKYGLCKQFLLAQVIDAMSQKRKTEFRMLGKH